MLETGLFKQYIYRHHKKTSHWVEPNDIFPVKYLAFHEIVTVWNYSDNASLRTLYYFPYNQSINQSISQLITIVLCSKLSPRLSYFPPPILSCVNHYSPISDHYHLVSNLPNRVFPSVISNFAFILFLYILRSYILWRYQANCSILSRMIIYKLDSKYFF